MKQVCHRTLFETTVHHALPIGRSGCLLPLPCSSLAGSLDLPSHWRLHNYLLYQNVGAEGYEAYTGETTGRLLRVLEDKAGTKKDSMGRALLFFSTSSQPRSVVRNTLEARLYYALRRQPNWRFSNSPSCLSVKQTRGTHEDNYIEHCIQVACKHLLQEGALGSGGAPQGWRPAAGQFEMSLSHEGREYYADAVLNDRNRWEVTAGSYAQKRPVARHDDHRPLREGLIRQGILQAAGSNFYRFVRPHEFRHPTTAAGVIAGQNVPGMFAWRERGTGRPVGNCCLPDQLRGRWPAKHE